MEVPSHGKKLTEEKDFVYRLSGFFGKCSRKLCSASFHEILEFDFYGKIYLLFVWFIFHRLGNLG